ncbi:MAG: IclR family transcriptional regulator, regulon repressor [Thermomicrobiales bacterium]|jgi:IclR family acetate operon transcriptional repressor|nr:IclR family transcriptional regulator, regulon repressor [Thermomicrobiales bacterium]
MTAKETATETSDGVEKNSPDYSIAVLDRALDVLEALADAAEPLGVTELARRVGATKSAAYRILANLERRGYVSKDPTTARYSLGTRLAYLGQQSLGTFDLRQVARSVLEELYRSFHETVNLGVLEGDEVVYIDMVESHHGLRMAARVGARDTVHSTALGKAILAFLPPEAIDRRLQRPLPRRTEHTITDPGLLAAELARVRARGVAEDHAENELGARCVAAPIFDHGGSVVAAISVSSPESRLDDPRAAEVATAVRAAAQEITRRVGGREPLVASG